MSKQLVRGQELYLAPGIRGQFRNGTPYILDERDGNELDPYNLDDKITIYEREVKEWFLLPTRRMLEQDSFKNSFVSLMVCMAYIEGVQQYKSGTSSNRQSKQFFVKSMRSIYEFRFTKKNIENLYKKTRCGLFHNGMVDGGVIFNNSFPEVFDFHSNNNEIRINPSILLNDLEEDFERYIIELRSNSESSETIQLKTNFDVMFSVLPN